MIPRICVVWTHKRGKSISKLLSLGVMISGHWIWRIVGPSCCLLLPELAKAMAKAKCSVPYSRSAWRGNHRTLCFVFRKCSMLLIASKTDICDFEFLLDVYPILYHSFFLIWGGDGGGGGLQPRKVSADLFNN